MSRIGKFTIGFVSDGSKYSQERIDPKFNDFGAFLGLGVNLARTYPHFLTKTDFLHFSLGTDLTSKQIRGQKERI